MAILGLLLGLLAIFTGASFVSNYEVLKAKVPERVILDDVRFSPYIAGGNLWRRDCGFVSMALGGLLIIVSLSYSGIFQQGGQP